jgi:hypothetical protein
MAGKRANKTAPVLVAQGEGRPRAAKPIWREHAARLEAYVEQKAPPVGAIDLADLPPELLRELRTRPAKLLEARVLSVVRDMNGQADLDAILIGLYRKYQLIQKRRVMQNLLWRLVRKRALTTDKAARGSFFLPGFLPGTKPTAAAKPKKRR